MLEALQIPARETAVRHASGMDVGIAAGAVRLVARFVQSALIASVRPYVSADLPGASAIYRGLVGRSWSNFFWSDAGSRLSRSKFHTYSHRFLLSEPAEREAFFLKRWHDLATQIFMREFIRQGDRVVDIGAGRGLFALQAAYLTGVSGHVTCFEPNPEMGHTLEVDFIRNGIQHARVVQVAAGDSAGRSVLTVPRYDNLSGSLTTLEHVGDVEARYHVSVEPADRHLGDIAPALIKIATEGYELHAIRGLKDTIARCYPVLITDLSPVRLATCGSSTGELMAHMSNLGYLGFRIELSELSEVAAWSVRPLSPADREIKAIWVHEKSPAEARELVLRRMVSG
jgi:FkbM family methyltransferase